MSDGPKLVYVLTPTAVYDHGCAGIFSDREAAIARADELYRQSDGHHDIRIDEIAIDQPIDVAGTLGFHSRRAPVEQSNPGRFEPWVPTPDPEDRP